MPINRRFTLVRRPHGLPRPSDFALAEASTPELAEGEFLIRNHYASIDPAMRGWMNDVPSYLPPVPLGEAMRATTVGTVTASRSAAFPEGAWVMGLNALEDYSVGREGGFTQPIDPGFAPVTAYLSVLGTIGLTAYFGLLDLGGLKAGETVLVSGAAGAVGSLVGQMAVIKGARAIGVAGGPAKCERLTRDYGYLAAIDYRGKDERALAAEIGAAAPGGIDLHFENVGGAVLEAALTRLRPRGRVVLCGLISEYNSAPVGVRNLWQLIAKGASIRGFILTQYMSRAAEAMPTLAQWVREGRLRADEHIDEGLENALPAMLRLFEGTNEGKMILKIA